MTNRTTHSRNIKGELAIVPRWFENRSFSVSYQIEHRNRATLKPPSRPSSHSICLLMSSTGEVARRFEANTSSSTKCRQWEDEVFSVTWDTSSEALPRVCTGSRDPKPMLCVLGGGLEWCCTPGLSDLFLRARRSTWGDRTRIWCQTSLAICERLK